MNKRGQMGEWTGRSKLIPRALPKGTRLGSKGLMGKVKKGIRGRDKGTEEGIEGGGEGIN